MGSCIGCQQPIYDDEPYQSGEEISCVRCAATWQNLLSEYQFYESVETGDPMTEAEAKSAFAKHEAMGGVASDKLIDPPMINGAIRTRVETEVSNAFQAAEDNGYFFDGCSHDEITDDMMRCNAYLENANRAEVLAAVKRFGD